MDFKDEQKTNHKKSAIQLHILISLYMKNYNIVKNNMYSIHIFWQIF